MSHLPTVWLKENQVRLVGSSRSLACNYKLVRDMLNMVAEPTIHLYNYLITQWMFKT